MTPSLAFLPLFFALTTLPGTSSFPVHVHDAPSFRTLLGKVYLPRNGSEGTTADGLEVGFTQDGHPYLGPLESAVVQIELFCDFQCPYCRLLYQNVIPPLLEDVRNSWKVALVFVDFPLTSLHSNALVAALAARCAMMSGAVAYWSFHMALMTKGDLYELYSWTAPYQALVTLAHSVGDVQDIDAFATCVANQTFLVDVTTDMDYGVKHGVPGTPTLVIGDNIFFGMDSYNQLKNDIQKVALVYSKYML